MNENAFSPVNTANNNVASVDLEWSGGLSSAAGNGALFSLLLSMHFQPGMASISLIPEKEEKNSELPVPANYYRRPALSASQGDMKNLEVTRQLMQESGSTSLFLWQSMHPDPLSANNDSSLIPDDVKANCSYITQQRLAGEYTKNLPVDETLLADIIESAPSMLSA